MFKLGYKLMSEEHGPAALVRNAQRAEQAGFDIAALSDHFSPWLEEQGHAPLAWSVLGALANATRRSNSAQRRSPRKRWLAGGSGSRSTARRATAARDRATGWW